jgi:hypothetical protein
LKRGFPLENNNSAEKEGPLFPEEGMALQVPNSIREWGAEDQISFFVLRLDSPLGKGRLLKDSPPQRLYYNKYNIYIFYEISPGLSTEKTRFFLPILPSLSRKMMKGRSGLACSKNFPEIPPLP